MKRLFKMMLSVLVTITMLASLCVNVSAAGRDVSSDVTVKSFKVISSATGEEIADGGELWDNQSYQFEWDWSFTATDKPIEEGDFIDIPTNLGTYLKNITLQPIVTKNGAKIADLSYDGSNIHIVFTENAMGLNALSFTTPEQTGGNIKTAVKDDASHKVTVGNLSKSFTFKAQPPVGTTPPPGVPVSTTSWKKATGSWGEFAYWGGGTVTEPEYRFYDTYNINIPACDEIGEKGDASKMTNNYKNTVVENTYPEDYTFAVTTISSFLSFYRDDGSWFGMRFNSLFSGVKQNAGESYADFKARVTAKGLQYGVYVDEDGRNTLVVSVTNSTTKYSDIFGMDSYSYAKSHGLTEAESQRFAQAFKDDGNGAVLGVLLNGFARNTNPIGRQVAPNTATKNTLNQDGTNGVIDGKITYTTVAKMPSSPNVQANTLAILNQDDSNPANPIAGNTFKIEKKDSNGVYQPYATATAGTSGWTTNTSLVTGDYKVTQTSWATGYDANYAAYKEAQEFSYTAGDDQKVIVVVNRLTRLSVTYNKGDHGDFLDDVHLNLAPGVATPDYAGAKDTAATNDQNVGNPKAQEGYHFIGWKDVVASVVDKNVTYVAQWAENEYHITFNSNGADDTSVEAKNLTAKYDSVITSTTDFPTETLTKAGYVFGGWALVNGSTKAIDATNKMPARDITLYAIWQEADYSIKYDLNDSTDAPATPHTIADKTGLTWDATGLIPTTAPTRVGYNFAGWKFTEEKARTGEMVTSTTKYSELASATTMKTLTLQAQWTAKTNTAYTVEYYLKDSGAATYTKKADETETLAGTTNGDPTVTVKTFTGFTHEKTTYEKTGTTANTTALKIAADGSLVVKVYYTRNAHDVTYTYTGTVPAGAAAVPSKKTGVEYDTNQTVEAVPTLTGYTFSGWTTTDATVTSGAYNMPDKDVTFTGSFVPNTDTAYTVEHYQQQLDGTYQLRETESLTGTTDSTVTATQKTYTGYTFNAADSTASGTVAADGSLLLKMYYDIDVPAGKVIVIFDLQGAFDSEKPDQQIINPGDIPTKPADPVDSTGINKFYMWFTDKEMTQPYDFTKGLTENTTLYAGSYVENGRNGAYKVQYYIQNADKTYSLKEEKEYPGVALGTKVSAELKKYNGYTFNSKAAGTTLDGYVIANKELVLKVYYDMNTKEPTPTPGKKTPIKQNNGSSTTGKSTIKTGDDVSITGFVVMLLGSAFILIKRKALTK